MRRAKPALDALIEPGSAIDGRSQIAEQRGPAHWRPAGHRRAGSSPFIGGLGTATRQWEPPRRATRYAQFQAGVQLANRLGALSEIEFSEFVVEGPGFADAVGATPIFRHARVVARARARPVRQRHDDAQLEFTCALAPVAWSVGFMQQCAAGFVPGHPGRLVLPAGRAAPPVLSLAFDLAGRAGRRPGPVGAPRRHAQLRRAQTDPARALRLWRASAPGALAGHGRRPSSTTTAHPLAPETIAIIGAS